MSPYFTPQRDWREMMPLVPVILLGFALNPYLDATFYRAWQGTGRERAPLAFALGFGVFFLLMIVFTLTYTTPFLSFRNITTVGAMAIGLHMAVQTAFTMALHLRSSPKSRLVAAGAVALALSVALVTRIADR